MCGCQQSRGGPAKASAKNTQLYAMKAGSPIVKLFNIWHFMNKVALFHSQLCVGLDVWHKRFYVNQRTLICIHTAISLHGQQPKQEKYH